ncbi:MAG TPA: hypothetical protein VFQ61_13190 [Polyangiaceae bacterium]|nr:hypothetical protein [Polyangiaceae bacterium]
MSRWAQRKFEVLIVLGSLVLFAFGIGGAMAAYPGGTHLDPRTHGYDFTGNFWCDMLRDPALNGSPNSQGAGLAALSLWIIGAGLLPFWGILAESCSERGSKSWLRPTIRVLGISGSFGLMLVALLPSDRFPIWHGLAVTIGGTSGVVAAAVAIVASVVNGSGPRYAARLGALTLGAAVANLVQYARQIWFDASYVALLPALQKIASLCFFLWVATLSVSALRSKRRLPPPVNS